MCVEVPLELVELRPDGTALARPGAIGGGHEPRLVEVNLVALDAPVAVGDWVLAHAGFALHPISAEAACDALSIREAPSIRAALSIRDALSSRDTAPIHDTAPIREETP